MGFDRGTYLNRAVEAKRIMGESGSGKQHSVMK